MLLVNMESRIGASPLILLRGATRHYAVHQVEPYTNLDNYDKFESGAVFPCTTERRIKSQIETGLKASYQSSYPTCLAR